MKPSSRFTRLGLVASAAVFAISPALAADIILGSSTEPSSLDPQFSRTGNNQNVAAQIFDRLIEPDPNLQVTPALAESWRTSIPPPGGSSCARVCCFRMEPPDDRGRHLFARAGEGHPEQPGTLQRQCGRDCQHEGSRSSDHRVQDQEPDARIHRADRPRLHRPEEARGGKELSRLSTTVRPRSAPGPTK